MSTDDAPSRKPVSKPVGVPRRFAVGTLMVIVAMYSVLFAFLTSLGAHPAVFVVVVVFFTGVGVGQVVLFRGRRPRDASIVCGMLLCPAILLALFLAGFFLWELTLAEVDVKMIAQLLSAMVYLAIVGAPLGYAAGCVTAGVFFVMDRIKKARNDATSEPDQTRAAASDEVGDDGSPSLDERLWLPVRSALVGLWPRHKGRPAREALNIFIIVATLVGLAAPFQEGAWWVHLLGTAAATFVLALLRGVFLCRWKPALMLIFLGGMGALPPGMILRGLFLYPSVRVTKYVPLFVVILIGGTIGLLATAALGWARWRLEGGGAKPGRRATSRVAVGLVLLLIAVYAGASFWLFRLSRRPHQRALAAIDRLGGDAGQIFSYSRNWPVSSVSFRAQDIEDADLRWLSVFGDLASLDLHDTPVGDDGLAHIERFGRLQILELGGTRITDAGLRHLRGAKKLEILSLDDTQVTDAGLQHLQGLPNLRWLILDHTRVAGPGLTHLKKCARLSLLGLREAQIDDASLGHLQSIPGLMELDLTRTQVMGEGLGHLANHAGLVSLILTDCPVTDCGLSHLRGTRSLQELRLDGTRVADAGLAHLAGLRTLRYLDLGNTKVTDAGLLHLKGLKGLTGLDVRNTGVTEACVKRFRQALPNCKVYGTDSSDGWFPPPVGM